MFETGDVLAFAGSGVVTTDDAAHVDRIQKIAVDDRRRRERSAARRAPDDEVVGLSAWLQRDVTGGAWTDGEDRLQPGVAAHHEDQPVPDDRRWRDNARRRRQRPDFA